MPQGKNDSIFARLDVDFVTLYDYANATHQSRSVASKDLRQIVTDPNSGITTRGSHSHKVWVAKNEGE